MRPALLIIASALAVGCGANAKEAAPADSPANAAPQSDDPNRRLTKSECESLGQTIVDACNSRGNDRSSEADGWCSDMIRRNTGGGTWAADDCEPHFKYMDAFCFRGGSNAHAMMVCDRTVDRSH